MPVGGTPPRRSVRGSACCGGIGGPAGPAHDRRVHGRPPGSEHGGAAAGRRGRDAAAAVRAFGAPSRVQVHPVAGVRLARVVPFDGGREDRERHFLGHGFSLRAGPWVDDPLLPLGKDTTPFPPRGAPNRAQPLRSTTPNRHLRRTTRGGLYGIKRSFWSGWLKSDAEVGHDRPPAVRRTPPGPWRTSTGQQPLDGPPVHHRVDACPEGRSALPAAADAPHGARDSRAPHSPCPSDPTYSRGVLRGTPNLKQCTIKQCTIYL